MLKHMALLALISDRVDETKHNGRILQKMGL